MFHFPQGSENRFPSGSELLPCEQVPERANFRNIPWILAMKRNSLWTFLLIAATKIVITKNISPSTENGIIIYTHEFVSRTRAYN
ncbi:hypothetical protein BpHYR1_001834 [Brachionus plicatilis]|uniref:Uncharacterized protein n=1 Tax=Brachionus plicatilis TaxID=10195 RepID=A0A3M7PHK4_BRAPC|nr:hypothetical protein BpHYR1_001834 [Brachionus plicatilis]